MRQKNLDLLLVLLTAVVSISWVFLPNRSSIVGIFCAFPLVFIAPGYSIIEAFFMDQDDSETPLIRKPNLKILFPINSSDRLILSLGLSLAIVILTGFVLNMLPIGLEQTSWIYSLALLTIIFSIIALYRRQKMKPSTKNGVPIFHHLRASKYGYILIIISIFIVILSVWYSSINAQQQQQQLTFTQFWMVPSKQAHNSCAVLIGIQSFEATAVKYDVVVTANGTKLSSWDAIVLAPRDQWFQSITVQQENANTVYIEAKLYRTDKPSVVYRDVHITLNSSQGTNGLELIC